ncbi:hypothetical protein DN752_17790 [Echinicola strongylocentroti]|uniref:Uncharacterized protein n=1 Tax=Echinicola strongylocentroti TaxID=1795355 RepID=A0A2Z4IN77_9BACT|nr:DUF6712 family protein [Echinicola strongylocentroti]AWW31833.1 hypothetical protein DN752_17790 [Echinicola strongylocentroti]
MMLINSTEELKEYIPASIALGFDDIKPKIRLVEREVIKRIFSSAIYDRATNAGAADNDRALKELLSEAVAHLALLQYIDMGQVLISSSGIQIASNENTKTAFEWQIDGLKKQCSLQGWGAVESALAFMETLPEGDLLTAWEETDTYKDSQMSVLSTLKQFEQYVSLHHSRVLFNKLLPTMTDQQEKVKAALGDSLWTKVVGYSSEEDSAQKTRLLRVYKKCGKALAYFTVAEGFVDTMLVLSDNGPLVIEAMQSRMPKAVKTAPEDLVKFIAENYRGKANGVITDLLAYLQENIEHFPEFKDSENYIDDEDQTDHIARNDPDWGLAFF